MSNIHNIRIEGLVPYNLPARASVDLARQMAWFLMRDYGFKFDFGNITEGVPNKHKGITTFYSFVLQGSEAMWEKYIISMVQDMINAGCAISVAEVEDIEYPVPLHSIMGDLKGEIIVSPTGTPLMVKDSKWPD